MKKQLDLMLIKISEWERVGNELFKAPINMTMPDDIQQIKFDITNLKMKIVSNSEFAQLYFNMKTTQKTLDRLTALNINFTEYDDMLAKLKPGKEVMMSCYNRLRQILTNTVYPTETPYAQTYTGQGSECLKTSPAADALSSCTMLRRVSLTS